MNPTPWNVPDGNLAVEGSSSGVAQGERRHQGSILVRRLHDGQTGHPAERRSGAFRLQRPPAQLVVRRVADLEQGETLRRHELELVGAGESVAHTEQPFGPEAPLPDL